MKKHVAIHLFKAFYRVNYHTFQVKEREQTETDSFFDRFEQMLTYLTRDIDLLVTWITEIGQRRVAKARYFRFENDANALPPPARIMAELGDDYCRLRLYCIRLTNEIVILANGGLKTERTVQNSPELFCTVRFANKMASQLIVLIRTGELITEGKEIVYVKGIDLFRLNIII